MLNGQLSQKCVGDPIHYFVLCKFCLTEKLLIIRAYIYTIYTHALLLYKVWLYAYIYMWLYVCIYIYILYIYYIYILYIYINK